MNEWGFLLVTIATLYLTETMHREELKGPRGILSWLRARPKLGPFLACPWCFGPYAWVILAALYVTVPPLVWPLAGAGAMLALRSYSGVSHG